jgi:CHAT domain-containing protein/tetratricopeptide (TPR) repeat protein
MGGGGIRADRPTEAPAQSRAGPQAVATAESVRTLVEKGRYADAEAAGRRLLARAEALSGRDSLDAAAAIHLLVDALWWGGKAGEEDTRALAERALVSRERRLGAEHPDVAESLHDLAKILDDRGDLEAEGYYERALAIRERALGPDDPVVAETLGGLASVRWAKGETTSARELLDRSLAIREKALGPDHPEVARALTALGGLADEQGDADTARKLLERALAIREGALGPDHPVVAYSLNSLATLRWRMGDYAEAQALHERALRLREKVLGADHPDVAASHHNLGLVLSERGDFGAARQHFERALALFEAKLGPEHPHVALALNSLGSLSWKLGELEPARKLLERALALQEGLYGPSHPDVYRTTNNLAMVIGLQGDDQGARRLYERSLAIVEQAMGQDSPEVAHPLQNLATVLVDQGDLAEAEGLLERALRLREKGLGPEHPDVASTLDVLANVLARRGDLARAGALLERAREIQERALGPEHPDLATTLNDLATVQIRAGAGAAEPLLRRSLAIRESSYGKGHLLVAETLDNLAWVLAAEGDAAEARAAHDRAVTILEAALGPDHPETAASRLRRAGFLASTGSSGQALEETLRAEEAGREHLQLALRGLGERQALLFAASRTSGRDLALTLLADGAPEAVAGRAQILDLVVRGRALVLDEMAQRRRAARDAKSPTLAQAVAALGGARQRLARLVVRGPSDEEPASFKKMVEGARAEKDRAEEALAERSASFREERIRTRRGLPEVTAALSQDAALVAFVRYERLFLSERRRESFREVPSYLAFVLRAGSPPPTAVPLGDAQAVEARVEAWRANLLREGLAPGRSVKRSLATARSTGEALRRAIWDPLLPSLSGVRRLFVVPDGALHLVSFAALPVAGDRYLVEQGPLIHYLSAERDLAVPSRPASGHGLLAVGNPDFDDRSRLPSPAPPAPKAGFTTEGARPLRGTRSACGDLQSLRFAPLPASGPEIDEVSALWRQGEDTSGGGDAEVAFLRGTAASETAFKARAAGPRVIHLATHGFFLGASCESAAGPASPRSALSLESPLLRAGLAFAGANQREAAGPEEDDGILTAEEVAGLDLEAAEWAVLSACDTGVGDVRAGEGVLGLRRAFEIAGVRTLIMSLWPVEDRSSREWMRALYGARRGPRAGTAERVQEATLEVLRARRKARLSTHPFYWAPFVAAGDWR